MNTGIEFVLIDSPYTDKQVKLKVCPFCGGKPDFRYVGNNYTRTRKITVECTSCRIQRTDAAITHGFNWLEEVAERRWNQRLSDVDE
jgi:hypothetical protein